MSTFRLATTSQIITRSSGGSFTKQVKAMRAVREADPGKGAKLLVDVVFAIPNRCLLMMVFGYFFLGMSLMRCEWQISKRAKSV